MPALPGIHHLEDRVCPYCSEKVGPRAIDQREPGAILGGFIPHARYTTVIILLINFGLYVATSIYSEAWAKARALVAFGAK